MPMKRSLCTMWQRHLENVYKRADDTTWNQKETSHQSTLPHSASYRFIGNHALVKDALNSPPEGSVKNIVINQKY